MRNVAKRTHLFHTLVVSAWAVVIIGCGQPNTPPATPPPAQVPEVAPGYLQGYLTRTTIPNSFDLLPAPPAAGSAAFAMDEEIATSTFALRGTPRWTQAISDANLRFPHAAGTFSCAVNAPITEADTPHLYMLLHRSLTDAAIATYAAKEHYNRQRPFLINKEPICTPEEQEALAKEGSYPSGHTSIGWAWALIMTEVAPDSTDAVLARGLSFGESRNVCNAHWRSDVLAGRVIGASTVARLHAEDVFRAELDIARAELAAVRAKGLPPTRDCAAEAAALAK
jgi:acid phosphatase (class A)